MSDLSHYFDNFEGSAGARKKLEELFADGVEGPTFTRFVGTIDSVIAVERGETPTGSFRAHCWFREGRSKSEAIRMAPAMARELEQYLGTCDPHMLMLVPLSQLAQATSKEMADIADMVCTMPSKDPYLFGELLRIHCKENRSRAHDEDEIRRRIRVQLDYDGAFNLPGEWVLTKVIEP